MGNWVKLCLKKLLFFPPCVWENKFWLKTLFFQCFVEGSARDSEIRANHLTQSVSRSVFLSWDAHWTKQSVWFHFPQRLNTRFSPEGPWGTELCILMALWNRRLMVLWMGYQDTSDRQLSDGDSGRSFSERRVLAWWLFLWCLWIWLHAVRVSHFSRSPNPLCERLESTGFVLLMNWYSMIEC